MNVLADLYDVLDKTMSGILRAERKYTMIANLQHAIRFML
jgi:hypothetical protein